jgi:hypothetical protein
MIKTKEQAREYAIDFQNRIAIKKLSYKELFVYQNKLIKLAKKFQLIEEFQENGII